LKKFEETRQNKAIITNEPITEDIKYKTGFKFNIEF